LKSRVLVVDDEQAIADLICYHLSREGFEVGKCHDGESALRLVREDRWDLVILDIMLPRLSGWEVLRALGMEKRNVPVLVLSARGEEADKVAGLELGADDYVTKPFSPRELVARVRAHLRRKATGEEESRAETVRIGPLEINLPTRSVTVSGSEVNLTVKEFDLLAFLARNADVVFSREKLLEEIWGYDFAGDTRTVDVHISRIRQKIDPLLFGPDGGTTLLEPVRGIGYRLSLRNLKAAKVSGCV